MEQTNCINAVSFCMEVALPIPYMWSIGDLVQINPFYLSCQNKMPGPREPGVMLKNLALSLADGAPWHQKTMANTWKKQLPKIEIYIYIDSIKE